MVLQARLQCALLVALVLAPVQPAPGSENLQATFEKLQSRLAASSFGYPLVLESSEEGGKVRGDVFAIVNHPFSEAATALDSPGEWCEVLIMHLNVKTCVASSTEKGSALQMTLGAKRASRADAGHALDFRFNVVDRSARHFQISMQADDGPLGTSHYNLLLEAMPIAPAQSFLHLAYAYSFSATASLAMTTYLHTMGREKVGFTVMRHGPDGKPVYIGGMRGVLERNTMRYYLGIETLLASPSIPLPVRRQWQLSHWFDATEKFGRQLHEMTRDEYLSGKESEL